MTGDWGRAIDGAVDDIEETLRAVRRHLHAHPEPSLEEFETTRYLAGIFEERGIPHRLIPSGRGLVAESSPDSFFDYNAILFENQPDLSKYVVFNLDQERREKCARGRAPQVKHAESAKDGNRCAEQDAERERPTFVKGSQNQEDK